jgi:hypothetical protein
MLDESEWAQLQPFLSDMILRIKSHRESTGASLSRALVQGYEVPALQKYFELTGFRETNVNALWHHRLSEFGPVCRVCGRRIRRPQSRFCAECGANAV